MAKGIDGVALITGAASGIGRETAYSFAEAGASGIVFADLNKSGAQEAADKSKKFAAHPNYRTFVVEVDVTDPAGVQAVVDAAVKEFGRIDYSVNSAGLGAQSIKSVADASVDEFDKLAKVNVKGTFLCVQAVTKQMMKQEPRTVEGRNGPRNIGRGCIVNLGSANSYCPVPEMVPYISSKHAVMGVTKTAALENGPHGIRVNAVCPSWVETAMMDQSFEILPELRGLIDRVVPLGRIAQPEEVGDVITFLCSPSASYLNGLGLLIDGGVTLTAHLG